MGFNTVGFAGNLVANTAYGPSPALWGSMRISDIMSYPNVGFHRFELWDDLPLAPTLTTQIAFGKYKAFCASGSTLKRVSQINSVNVIGGALEMINNSDNDAAAIAQAYPADCYLTGSQTTSGKLVFECALARSGIATNFGSYFVGLGETNLMTLAATVPLNAGDPISNAGSMFGFHMKEDGLGVVDTVVSDRATSFTDIQAGIGTMVANTVVKLGFVYEFGTTPNANRVTFFYNGLPCTTFYTNDNIVATTNLKANALGFLFAGVADSGAPSTVFLPWYRIAQYYPGHT